MKGADFLEVSNHEGVGEELIEVLAQARGGRLERIVSRGQVTPEGKWYDQEEDEWVLLLKGAAIIRYEDGTEDALSAGGWVWIPAHRRHRVVFTSVDPPCLWLAVFLET